MLSKKINLGIIAAVIFFLVASVEAEDVKMKDAELHPKFPVVEGNYQMTKEWSVTLPGKFSRRIEEGSLVL